MYVCLLMFHSPLYPIVIIYKVINVTISFINTHSILYLPHLTTVLYPTHYSSRFTTRWVCLHKIFVRYMPHTMYAMITITHHISCSTVIHSATITITIPNHGIIITKSFSSSIKSFISFYRGLESGRAIILILSQRGISIHPKFKKNGRS